MRKFDHDFQWASQYHEHKTSDSVVSAKGAYRYTEYWSARTKVSYIHEYLLLQIKCGRTSSSFLNSSQMRLVPLWKTKNIPDSKKRGKEKGSKGSRAYGLFGMKQSSPWETHCGGRTRPWRGCTGHPNQRGGSREERASMPRGPRSSTRLPGTGRTILLRRRWHEI